MPEDKLFQIMSDKSTFELVDILAHRKDHYRPEAIVAIEQVLKERNIPEAEMNNLVERSQQKHIEMEAERAKKRTLFQGPGIIITVLVILSFFLLVPERDWLQTVVFAVIGFGAGHAVNYFYFKSKSSNDGDKLDL